MVTGMWTVLGYAPSSGEAAGVIDVVKGGERMTNAVKEIMIF